MFLWVFWAFNILLYIVSISERTSNFHENGKTRKWNCQTNSQVEQVYMMFANLPKIILIENVFVCCLLLTIKFPWVLEDPKYNMFCSDGTENYLKVLENEIK